MTILSDATTCMVTYDHHADDFRGVIYDGNILKIQATGNTVLDPTNHKPKHESSNPANGTQRKNVRLQILETDFTLS
jgi:hypothetical protein